MSFAAKTVTILFGVILTVILTSWLLVTLLFDPNQYKAEICKLIAEKTGRQLSIHGEIDLNVFPWLGIKANNVEMANAEGFGPEPFASIQRVKVRVRFFSLLRKQLEFGRISVTGLQLNLTRKQDGTTNWQDLLPASSGSDQHLSRGFSAGFVTPALAADSTLAAFSISGIHLKRCTLIWNDLREARRVTIWNMGIDSGYITPGKDFDIHWQFDFRSEPSFLSGHTNLTTLANVNSGQKLARFSTAQIDLTLNDPSHLARPMQIRVKSDAVAGLDPRIIELDNLSVETDVVKTEGHLVIGNSDEGFQMTGQLASNTFDPRVLLKAFGKSAPPTRDPDALTKTSLQCAIDSADETLQLHDCSGILDDTNISGQLTFDNKEKRRLEFAAQVDRIDLDRYRPPERPLTPPSEQKPVVESTEGPADKDSKESESTGLRHNAGPVLGLLLGTLTPSPAHAAQEYPIPYRDIALQGSSPQPDQNQPGTSETTRYLPFEFEEIDGTIEAQDLTIDQHQVTDFSCKIQAHGKTLSLVPVKAHLCGGSGAAAVKFSLASDPEWRSQFIFSGVEIEKLLPDDRKRPKLKGTLNLKGALEATGSTKEAIQESLEGKLQLELTKVKGSEFNIGQAILNATPMLHGKLPAAVQQSATMTLDQITATIDVHDGVFSTDDLRGSSPAINVTGFGRVDPINNHLDLMLTAVLRDDIPSILLRSPRLAFLLGVPIHIRVNGPLSDPVTSLDVREILKSLKKP